jgi:hypothetical protein
MAIFSAAFYSLVSPALAFYNMARVVHFAPGGETLVAIMESAEQSLNILISHGGLPSLLSLAALSCFSLAGLGFSLVFLKDKQKKSWKAWIGIAAHGFALLYIPCSFLFYYMSRGPNHCTMGRNIAVYNNCFRSYFTVIPNMAGAKNGCIGSNQHTFFQGGMALSLYISSTTKSYSMK